MADYILAIDQGTTGTKTLVMNENLEPVAEANVGFRQIFPEPGWVEHDLNDIWGSVVEGIRQISEKIDVKKIAAIGITNQRETVCFWDRSNAEPLTHAIVWQDRRTTAMCQELIAKGTEPFIQEATGLIIDPYFSGSKAAWAMKNWPAVDDARKQGHLAVGTIDSYLIARLSGGSAHVTEPSNASRTLCFHLTKHFWDPDLCSTLGVPADIWPEVRPSIGKFAVTRGVPGLPDGIPITGALGDQQSALLGQACIEEGSAKCTYGTGAFILMNTGKKPVRSRHRLLSTVAWAFGENQYTYALEGSAFMAGATVQWLRDGLGIIKNSADVEALAASVDTTDGVVLVPAMTGLGAPHWDPHARGMIAGITRGTTAAHIARAALEGIAFQNAEILLSMQKDLGKPVTSLNVDGGASANNLLMQFQADVLGAELVRPVHRETTVLGAVFAAGLGIGIWSDLSEVKKTWREEKRFKPALGEKEREEAIRQWQHAIARVRLQPAAR